jgi:hypothetical protein
MKSSPRDLEDRRRSFQLSGAVGIERLWVPAYGDHRKPQGNDRQF